MLLGNRKKMPAAKQSKSIMPIRLRPAPSAGILNPTLLRQPENLAAVRPQDFAQLLKVNLKHFRQELSR